MPRLWPALVWGNFPRGGYWEAYRPPLPGPINLKFLFGGIYFFRKNCLPVHPLEVEIFFKALVASILSLATLPKSAPNKRGGALEKSEYSIKPFNLGLSCCSTVFLCSAAKYCEAFPRRTRAAWVLATADLRVSSPASAISSVDTRGSLDPGETGGVGWNSYGLSWLPGRRWSPPLDQAWDIEPSGSRLCRTLPAFSCAGHCPAF